MVKCLRQMLLTSFLFYTALWFTEELHLVLFHLLYCNEKDEKKKTFSNFVSTETKKTLLIEKSGFLKTLWIKKKGEKKECFPEEEEETLIQYTINLSFNGFVVHYIKNSQSLPAILAEANAQRQLT